MKEEKKSGEGETEVYKEKEKPERKKEGGEGDVCPIQFASEEDILAQRQVDSSISLVRMKRRERRRGPMGKRVGEGGDERGRGREEKRRKKMEMIVPTPGS